MSELLCAEFGTKGWIKANVTHPPITAFVEWLCTKEHDCAAHNKGDVWQASSICCNTGCSGYWRPINRDCEQHGVRLRDCDACETQAEHLAMRELIDGCYEVVALFDCKSPSQLKWREDWLRKANLIVPQHFY